ncbi:MAG: TonB-dependent receptor [Chlorobi bacterium]|nr:TonB-dependent receptor [Chlorobiota bacterium]
MNKKFLSIITVITIFSSFSSSIKSQIKDTIKINEVIIKATKTDETLQDAPASISFMNSTGIRETGVENIEDLNAIIPNLFIPNHGSRLTSPVYIRGIGSRINSQAVGLYVDNIPYFESGSFNFELFDISSIEVLRGPQGTLYGRNTMGGLINITTSPVLDQKVMTLGVDYGNYNRLKTVLHYNTPVTDKLSMSIDGAYTRSDGFFTNTYLNNSPDSYNLYSGRLKIKYDVSEKLKINFVASYEKNDENGYPYAIYDTTTQTRSDINYNEKSFYNRDLFSTGANIKYDASSFILTSSTSYQYLKDEQAIDQDFTPKDLFFVDQNRKHHTIVQEFTIKSKNESRINWIGGVFGFLQNKDKDVDVFYGDDAVEMYHLPGPITKYKTYSQPTTGAAAYGQVSIPFHRFNFTAGIRLDYERDDMEYNYDMELNGNYSNVQYVDTFNTYTQILPKAVISYMFNSDINTYVSVSKGYKAGGFNSTFERDEDISFDPESSINYEWGLKSELFNRRLSVNLAMFYIDWKDQQVYQPVPSGHGAMLKNAGRTTSKGFELETTYTPISNFRAWMNFGYNDVTYDDYQNSETIDYSGNKLPYIPVFTVSTGASYMKKLNGNFCKSLTFAADYRYIGKFYWNDANSAYQSGYGLLGANISINTHKNFRFGIYGKNLLDTDYNSFYFEALGNSYVQQGDPLQVSGFVKIYF